MNESDPLTILVTIQQTIEESLLIQRRVLKYESETIAQIAQTLLTIYRAGGKVLLFGNGGSAADAQHVAGELVGRFRSAPAPLPAIALTTDTSILSSLGNDFGFDHIFARQVMVLARPGDLVVGISTSGNSSNVLEALKVAKNLGAVTVGFTGRDGGRLKDLVDHCLCVPSDDTPRIQEAHILAWHAICEVLEQVRSA